MNSPGWLPKCLTPLMFALCLSACSSQRATNVPDGSQGYDTIKGSEEDRSILIACKVPGVAGTPLASH
jgi:hypothetical protein